MVIMRVADQENLNVIEFESELLNAGPNQRNVRLEIAVNQDVSLRSSDQVIREAFAADIVEISGDVKWRIRLGPFTSVLRRRGACETEEERERARQNDRDSAPSVSHNCTSSQSVRDLSDQFIFI